MADSFGWTPRRNQDISFEDGLALIDAFYESPNRDALPGTAMPPSISPPLPDAAQAAGLAQTIDEVRSVAAIAQLPDSPVDRSITNKRPILPSSPPQQEDPQWQPNWTAGLPPSFTSPPITTNAPPPSPATGLVATIQSVSFPVASHIKSSPPQMSRVTPPSAFAREDDSPTVTTSKAGSSSLATSKNTSPDLSTPKIDSPILTATPISISAPAFPKPPIPLPTSSAETKLHVPNLSAGTGARPSSVAKENKNPSSKALKKKATDSPGSASAPRSVKKLRCVRCVKQHGACDLDTKHPCSRCAKAKVAPEECVPRDYSKRRSSTPAVGPPLGPALGPAVGAKVPAAD